MSTKPATSKIPNSASSTSVSALGGKPSPTPAKTPSASSPVLRAKSAPAQTPSKATSARPVSKTPGKAGAEKAEPPKPVTIPEIYQYLKRQFLNEDAVDAQRDAYIKTKIADSFKDGLNFEEDVLKTKDRIYGPTEAARAESKQLQEDSTKQVSILRRKFLEEEGKNERLQQETEKLRNTISELTTKLMFAESSLNIEKSQANVLLETVLAVEKEAAVAHRALTDIIHVIGTVKRSPQPANDHSSDSTTTPAHQTTTTHDHTTTTHTTQQQILDAENAIKNLTLLMKSAEVGGVGGEESGGGGLVVGGEVGEVVGEGASVGVGEEGEKKEVGGESEDATPNGREEEEGVHANGVSGEDNASSGSEGAGAEEEFSDDEVIHVQQNGDHASANEGSADAEEEEETEF